MAFKWGSCCAIFRFMCSVSLPTIVLSICPFSFSYCIVLPSSILQLKITPLIQVSSNFSQTQNFCVASMYKDQNQELAFFTTTLPTHGGGDGLNVRHNWKPLCGACMQVFTYSISYCKDNIKCDSASHAPTFPLNNGVSIVQKLVVKTLKRFQQCYLHLLTQLYARVGNLLACGKHFIERIISLEGKSFALTTWLT